MSLKRVEDTSILEKIKQADELYSNNQLNEAILLYQELINEVDDSYSYDKCELYRKLGNSYYYLPDYDKAIVAYENTLRFYQNNGSIYNILGYMYFYKNSDKSIENYLKGMELHPDFGNFVMLTQVMIKSKKYSQKDLKEVFEKYVDIFRPQVLNGDAPYNHAERIKDKNKKLKIGYISSDFYCHAMMEFVLPILEHHDLKKFDIILYSCGTKKDSVTERIQKVGYTFKDCSGMTNKERAAEIYKDGIDILIDLSGYTHQAIWTLLYKPAPIQCQYLGFLGTYGIREVDYILADKFTIPDDMVPYYTEKPMYINSGMNRFTFNTKNQTLPSISELPYKKNGYITFGSFNCVSKINPYTVFMWSRVLKAVPTSKLLIYRTQMQERDVVRFKKQFAEYGIDDTRVIYRSEPVEGTHFNAFALCDVALDPLPFSGLTITIEQMHMGIPVLALAGETISAKGAARINAMLGLDDFTAFTEEEYVERAVQIAANPEKLDWYRKHLRGVVQKSYLCTDYKNYVREIEEAYIEAWQKL